MTGGKKYHRKKNKGWIKRNKDRVQRWYVNNREKKGLKKTNPRSQNPLRSMQCREE